MALEFSIEQVKKENKNINIEDIARDDKLIFEVLYSYLYTFINFQKEKTKTLKEDFSRTKTLNLIEPTEDEIHSEFSELEVSYTNFII